ncbi:CHAT domain-containing protein [Variovorax ureilyticus]|uniref:CHAT domain-containing protein n=1 Tax=Variovorax ureilyticus TaxID=1836198 RepID=A0ABU8VEB6_9BURK
MRTLKISIAAPRKPGEDFPVTLWSCDDDPPEVFVQVRGATSSIPAGLAPDEPVDDPGQPGTALTAARVIELHAAAAKGAGVQKEVGIYLRALLARGKLRTVWDDLREQGACRTLIDIAPDKPVEKASDRVMHALQLLPWERLRTRDQAFMFLEAGSPISRGIGVASLAPPTDWPLRVLVVNCAEPDKKGAAGGGIGADEEVSALERLFGCREFRYNVEFDVLENPGPAEIVAAWKSIQPHILHFIGHGVGGADPDQHALLLYQPGPGAGEYKFVPWRLNDIRAQFKSRDDLVAPRLAFLNACRTSGRDPGAEPAPMSSISDAFLRAGSLATIGMQGDVAGDLAAVFAREFYMGLMGPGDHPIDSAAQAARLAMSGHRPTADVLIDPDWSYPVLSLRALPHQVLPKSPDVLGELLAERFVARVAQRRRVHEAIRCSKAFTAAKPGAAPHMVVIVGDVRSGKSHLSSWSAQACQRAGFTVARVGFGEDEPVDWLDAMRWIRDGKRRTPSELPKRADSGRLPASAFRDFNWGLNHRQRGLTHFEPYTGKDDVQDLGVGLAEQSDIPETFFEDTAAQFRDALVKCATPNGLVLVLDQLEGLEPNTLSKWLPNGLLRPIAMGSVKGVRLILVLSGEQYEACRSELERLTRVPEVVRLEYFARADVHRIARHLCRQWAKQICDEVWYPPMLQTLLDQHRRNDTWNAELLKSVDNLCKQFNP